ncbi:MAG: CBS domain-containing protein [Candidatus Aenigmatarchaeota archaeon]
MLSLFRKKQTQESGCGLNITNFANPGDSVLRIASRGVLYSSENSGVIDALGYMLSGIRRLPVVDENERLTGIVSTTDVLDFIGGGEKHKLFSNTGLSAKVRKIMSPCIHFVSATDSIPVALEIFKESGKPIQPVMEDKKLVGVITETDIVNLMSKRTGVKVSDIMTRKPITVDRNKSVYDVARMLCRGPYRRLPVVNNGVLLGIVTPYDILSHLNSKEALNMLRFENSPIKEIMRKDVAYIRPDADIYEAVAMMKIKKVSGLPVVDEDADLLGMITKRDIINAMG